MHEKELIAQIRCFNRCYASTLDVYDRFALGTAYTLAQARIIGEIARQPGCSANDIALKLHIDRSYLSRILNGLEKNGFLSRQISPADARRKDLHLTTKGSLLQAEFEQRSNASIREQLATVTTGEREQLLAALQTIQHILCQPSSLPAPSPDNITISAAYDAIPAIQELFQEYTDALHIDLTFQHLDRELAHPELKYARPEGRLYLLSVNGQAAGCLAYHALDGTADAPGRTCELKRLYIRPAFRGRGLSRQLMARALHDAQADGYDLVRFDTLSRLRNACALYHKMGFAETRPYYDNPLPGVIYFAKKL